MVVSISSADASTLCVVNQDDDVEWDLFIQPLHLTDVHVEQAKEVNTWPEFSKSIGRLCDLIRGVNVVNRSYAMASRTAFSTTMN